MSEDASWEVAALAASLQRAAAMHGNPAARQPGQGGAGAPSAVHAVLAQLPGPALPPLKHIEAGERFAERFVADAAAIQGQLAALDEAWGQALQLHTREGREGSAVALPPS